MNDNELYHHHFIHSLPTFNKHLETCPHTVITFVD